MMVKVKRNKHRLFVLQRIVLSRIYRLLGPLNIHLQPKQAYCIKAGYHKAYYVETFDDRINKDEWQRSVYESALLLLKEIDGKSVIDLGCGSAYKLINMFGNYNTIGIELTNTYKWLLEKYPSGKWLAFEQTVPSQLESDMVICSDVIEHIKNPDEIMDFLKSMNFRYLVISTPERNSVRGNKDFGPPENPSHFREWNSEEFKDYVSKWFKVIEQIISQDKSVSQILICTA
jgi:2-polyprenyl-3-methyl-5-hydroxy-6-metoxy-1,4-benzoquinol methylase